VKRFWYRMGEIFGAAWYREHGSEATDLWRKSLSEISFERAALVVEHYRVSGADYPPTLSQIMKAARELRMPVEPHKALPAPAPDMDKVASAISDMRQATKRRYSSVFLPGESFTDYQRAMQESGMSKEMFDGMRLRMNMGGREPTDPEARAEREAIQGESE